MSLKLKGFHLEQNYWDMLTEIRERENLSSDAFALRKCIEALHKGKITIEKPAEISLEKAKEVVACPHYEAYPRNPDFVKCHQLEKPRIRSKRECQICKYMKTLYDQVSKDLNVIAKKKSDLEGEVRAKETSLRTVTSEYNNVKKELETLREKRASFQVVPSAPTPSPDPMLMQRLKELENEISEKNQKIKDLEAREPAPAPAKLEYEPLFQDPFNTEEILIETYEPLLPKAKAKYHQLIEEARKQGRKLTENLLEEFSEIAC